MTASPTNNPNNTPQTGVPLRWGYPILVALPLIVLNAGWIAHSEMRTGVTEITITTLFMGVTFILFLATLVNLAVRRFLGERAAMRPAELMVLYAMLSLATSMAGIGNLGFFTPFLGNAFRFANGGNDWQKFHPLLPAYVGPRDLDILKGFYEGNSSFFKPEIMAAWAFPLAFWALFLLLLLWTLLCLSVIVRRRWQEQEQLPFPVVTLPLEMTREDAPLYRNRLMWFAFAIPFILHSLNTLHHLFPSLPSLPINTSKQLLEGTVYPWTGLGSVLLLLHPAGVGFGYLVNTDVLFSLWFFHLLKKGLNLFGTMVNWRDPGPDEYGDGSEQFPFTGWQAWGAWLTIGIAVLWTGRGYFAAYFDRAFTRKTYPEDVGEPLTARGAVWGLIIGFLALCGLVWAVGASWWVPVAFLGIYLLIMLALSRLEAETAVLSPLLAWVNPQGILAGVLGTRSISQTDLAHVATLSWFNLDYRAAAMPQQLQSIVGLRRAGAVNLRPLAATLMLAAFVGIIAALLWDMQLYYTEGASTAKVNSYRVNMGNVPFGTLNEWLNNPKPPQPGVLLGMGAGGAITLLLTFLRSRFVGFPLSPAAYVLNVTWANELFWFDLFVAWVVKALLLRYGGMRLYRTALPFFLGLILGDFVTGAAWSLVGAALRVDMFRTFPN